MTSATVIHGELMLPGEWTPPEAAAYVTDAYEKSVLAFIETGRRLIECKSNLGHGNWLPFVALLPFSERTARAFMQIADHPAIANRQHVADLPAAWGTLAVLAQLPAAEIEARIEAREITPELDRATAEQWARVHQAARQESINAWTEAVDGLTRALSYFASGYTPPADLPASHVQPAEFLHRLDQLNTYAKEIA